MASEGNGRIRMGRTGRRRPRLMRGRAGIAGAAVCLLLAACGGLIDTSRPAAAAYWLEPLGATEWALDEARALDLHLTAVPGLDTDRILTLGPDARLGRLDQARWADHLPEVLRSVLGRSLRANGLEPQGRAAGCWLDLEVQAFYLARQPGEAGSAEVGLQGRFECTGRAADFTARAAAPAGDTSAGQAVAAFQRALDQATRELLRRAGEFLASP